MLKSNEISTNNEGILKIIKPFKLLRGIDNKDECMGRALNKQGELFEIYPAPCDIPTCFCWATAKKI